MRRDYGIEWGLQSAIGKCFQLKKKKKKSQNRKIFVLGPRFRDSLPWGNWWEKDQGLVTKQRPSYQNWDRKWELGWSWVTRSEQEQQLWPGAESLWPDAESEEDRPDWTQAWGHRWKSRSPRWELGRTVRAGTWVLQGKGQTFDGILQAGSPRQ